MKKTFALLACVLLVAGLAACNTDKGPAETRHQGRRRRRSRPLADEAEKYVPGAAQGAAKDALAAAKDKFAKGEYKEALAAATELGNKAKELAAATAAKKDELTKAWNDLAASLPQTVASIQAKIEELGKAKKLPKGMDKAKLAQAQEGLAGITKAWDEASAAFTAGNLGEALGRASTPEGEGRRGHGAPRHGPGSRSGRGPGRRPREVTVPSVNAPRVAPHGPGSSGAVAFLGPERRGDQRDRGRRTGGTESRAKPSHRATRVAGGRDVPRRRSRGRARAAPRTPTLICAPVSRPASFRSRDARPAARTAVATRFARCTRALA